MNFKLVIESLSFVYGLHNLHVQSFGLQCLILFLNSRKDAEFFIESRRCCQIYFTYNKVSVPYPTVLTLYVFQHLWFLRLCIFSYVGNGSCIRVGAILLLILNISLVNFCKFRWWIMIYITPLVREK